jgi:hypothetical protein
MLLLKRPNSHSRHPHRVHQIRQNQGGGSKIGGIRCGGGGGGGAISCKVLGWTPREGAHRQMMTRICRKIWMEGPGMASQQGGETGKKEEIDQPSPWMQRCADAPHGGSVEGKPSL